MSQERISFRALSFEERIARLEQLLELLKGEVEALKYDLAYDQQNRAEVGKFRGCDDALILLDGLQQELRILSTRRVVSREAPLVSLIASTGERKATFGLDSEGSFFHIKADANGEKLCFLINRNGFAFRDQNGRLGKVEVDGSNYLKFILL